jgi:anti-sigma-K factor RskA
MRRVPATAQHALAAEYVLGTLRGRARQRFEELLHADRALADVVRAWEAWLTPLAERIEPVEPPARVWQAIEARIALRGAAPPGATSFWSSLGFWRGLGTALAATLVALVVLFPRTQPGPQAPSMVAVLATPEADPRMVVERHADMLKVRVVKPWKEMPGQDLELWAIPAQGKPRSLGVVRFDKDSEVKLANLDQKLAGSVAFAVSREPTGGSPNPDGPTGPVVCSGPIARSLRA